MTDAIPKSALAWLLTYAIHSTIFLGAAWLVSRRKQTSVVTRDRLWKVALIGGMLTASAQMTLGVRPVGSLALTPASVSTRSTSSARTTASNDKQLVDEEQALAPSRASDTHDASALPPTPFRLSTAARILVAWGVPALILTIGYFARRLILVGRLANRRAITDGPLPSMIDALCREVGHTNTIALTSANTISSPVALGLREICLPEAVLTQLDFDQQRGLLAHELAHLVRRDPLWLYAASVIERVFFFQPLNRVARKALQTNSEYLCDDWAAARTGSGLPLAHCLARVAEWIEASPLGVPVAGMAEQRSLLVTRVARLIDGKRSGSPLSRLAFGGAAIALLGVVTAAVPGVQGAALSPAPTSTPTSRDVRSPRHSSGSAQSAEQEDPAVVAALIERLKDTDAGVRRAAASSLGRLKSRRAMNALVDALADKNAEVRSAVAEALGNIEDSTVVPALSKLLNDPSPDVREHVLDALGSFSSSLSATQVLPALHDARASLRAKAAEILGEIGDRAAVAPLTKQLSDPSPEVRHRALHALERLQDASAISAISPLLHDDNGDVREAALETLRELKGSVNDADIQSASKDPNSSVRQQAAEYLKEHPSPAAVTILRRMLDDAESDVRESAIDALADIHDPTARVALRDALKSSDAKVRRRAAEALGNRP